MAVVHICFSCGTSVHRAGCGAGGTAAACLSVSGASLLPLPEEVWIFLFEKSKANLLHSSNAKENLVVEERSSGRMWLFFNSGLVLYGERKCEVVRSASVTQSQKVTRRREGRGEKKSCVCLAGMGALWPCSSHSLSTVSSTMHGRFPSLTILHVAAPM